MPDGKKNLLLVTAGFPYGEWERGFLTTEFLQLCRNFSVTVLSVGREDPLLYPVENVVRLERYLYPQKLPSVATMLRYLTVPDVVRECLRAAWSAPHKKVLSRLHLINAYYFQAEQIADKMEQLIREQEIDIVYTYWATEPAVAACMLKKKYPQLRFVTRFHGHDLYRERKGSLWQPFRHLITARADRLFFACAVGMEYYLHHWGGSEKAQLHYLGCGEAPKCDHNPSDVLRIVSCSNLIPLKRVDCIIDALALLPAEVSVRWDHFGQGTEAEALERRAAQALRDNVTWTFHGHVPNHLLRQQMLALEPDVFLTVSSTEGGVPVSIQEAFSMGIPCIGSAAGGTPEAVRQGQTGFLLGEYPTAQELADALLRFRELPPEEKMAMSDGALALWRECFHAEKNAKNFIKELQHLSET